MRFFLSKAPSTFTPLFDEITARCGLNASATYGLIWRFSQMRDGICRASVSTIADRLKLNRSTIQRHISVLITDGYLLDLSPDLRNRPHIYKIAPHKFTQMKTSSIPSESPLSDANSATADAETSSRCGKIEHRSDANCIMSETFLRDEIKENKEENDTPIEAEKLWKPILENLKAQSSRSLYEKYIKPLTPLAWDGTTLTLGVPDPDLERVIQARAGTQIARLLTVISNVSDASIIIHTIN
jgi:DNA-binding transcriptional ArsR family regulator